MKSGLTALCFGGFAINAGRAFLKTEAAKNANVNVHMFDSSSANMGENEGWRIPGMNGAGGDRRKTHEAFVAAGGATELLRRCPVNNFAVALFSASGGTGNVIATDPIVELLKRQIPVVAIVLVECNSNLTIKNAMNTIRTLEAKAKANNVPITIFTLYDNVLSPEETGSGNQGSRSYVDKRAVQILEALSLLTSESFTELDPEDIRASVFYAERLGIQSRICEAFFSEPGKLANNVYKDSLYSTIGMLNKGTVCQTIGHYHKSGFYKEGIAGPEMLFCITPAGIASAYTFLEKQLIEKENQLKALTTTAEITSNKESTESDGYFF